MTTTRRTSYQKLFSSDLHSKSEPGKLKSFIKLLSNHQGFGICYSKFHTMVINRMKLFPFLDTHYNIEEEDGFQMVRVKAPPGAAESTTPGQIEWEKTVGSRVTAGEVVCKIRFKEDRTLDIKAPVTGTVAVRRKQEGDTVTHGDELFKIRLELPESLATKKKRKTAVHKDYYEEEEEMVGKSGVVGKGVSLLKSSFLSSRVSQERSDSKSDIPSPQRSYIQPLEQDSQPSDSVEESTQRYKREKFQSRLGLIPNPFPQHTAVPVSQLMTTINEINMKDTLEFINKFARGYEVKYGTKPCLKSIYVKAAAHALKLNNTLNIKLINDEPIKLKDLEIAVGIRHLKMIVFHTMKNIDKMSYVEISRVIKEVEKQISAGTYKTQKVERGFTLSTEWETGSVVGTPAHSNTCTLGIHNIIKRPIFEENKIIAYPMMYVSLTYDRKLIEDDTAVEFLKNFKESMEDPRHILVHSS